MSGCGRWCCGPGRRAVASRYTSQPRQKPKAALRNAAASAKPVATAPSRSAPAAYPRQGDDREPEPDGLGEPRRGGVLELARRPRRGRTSVLNSQAYGVCWMPSDGAEGEHGHLDGEQGDRRRGRCEDQRRPRGSPSSASPRTAGRAGRSARGRGCRCRCSVPAGRVVVDMEVSCEGNRPGLLGRGTARRRARRSDTGTHGRGLCDVPSGHSTQGRAHAAVVHCAALRQPGREHAARLRRAVRPSETVVSQCGY